MKPEYTSAENKRLQDTLRGRAAPYIETDQSEPDNATQRQVLAKLDHREKLVSEIAERVGMSSAHVRRAVMALEDNGLAVRGRDVFDGKVKRQTWVRKS